MLAQIMGRFVAQHGEQADLVAVIVGVHALADVRRQPYGGVGVGVDAFRRSRVDHAHLHRVARVLVQRGASDDEHGEQRAGPAQRFECLPAWSLRSLGRGLVQRLPVECAQAIPGFLVGRPVDLREACRRVVACERDGRAYRDRHVVRSERLRVARQDGPCGAESDPRPLDRVCAHAVLPERHRLDGPDVAVDLAGELSGGARLFGIGPDRLGGLDELCDPLIDAVWPGMFRSCHRALAGAHPYVRRCDRGDDPAAWPDVGPACEFVHRLAEPFGVGRAQFRRCPLGRVWVGQNGPFDFDEASFCCGRSVERAAPSSVGVAKPLKLAPSQPQQHLEQRRLSLQALARGERVDDRDREFDVALFERSVSASVAERVGDDPPFGVDAGDRLLERNRAGAAAAHGVVAERAVVVVRAVETGLDPQTRGEVLDRLLGDGRSRHRCCDFVAQSLAGTRVGCAAHRCFGQGAQLGSRDVRIGRLERIVLHDAESACGQ